MENLTSSQTAEPSSFQRSAGVALLLLLTAFVPLGSSQGHNKVPDEILVRAKPHLSEQALGAILGVHRAREIDRIPQLNVRVLRVPAEKRDRVLRALSRNPNIDLAEPNGLAKPSGVVNDPFFVSGDQWHLPKIKAPEAWDTSSGNLQTIIAMVDTGVETTHPDLQHRLVPGYNYINSTTNVADDHGHGTAVAGMAVAEGNNAAGVAGVAWNSAIMPLKAANAAGSATYTNIAKAIMLAADRGVRVINISLSGTTSSAVLQDAVDYAWNRNCVVIATAGNSGLESPVYPAACRNAVAVSATTAADEKSATSGFGAHIDIAAPGANVYTTVFGSTYGVKSGTSYATPLVAGVAALMIAFDPEISNIRLVEALLASADDLGAPGFDKSFGHGRVNAYQALVEIGAPVPDVAAPVVTLSSPVDGATVSGTVLVDCSAIDDIGVTRIDFYIDDELAGSSETSPATFAWDTTTASDGWHVLQARAFDAAGNEGRSTEVSVHVENVVQDTTAPVVAITSPAPGARIHGQLRVTIAASDDRSLSHAELYLNGEYIKTTSDLDAGFRLGVNKLPRGTHQLQVIAYDAAGNAGVSPSVTVVK